MTEIQDIVHDLRRVLGQENVAFDEVTRALYSTDASNYQIMPIGVTFPRHVEDVIAIHEYAAQHKIPLLPRGGGTSLAGQTVNHAIVMDFTRHMRRIRSINAEEKTVTVEPGIVLDQLNRQLYSLGLMFGPDPASANRATIGGCIGNNATGAHSILYRMTSDHVIALDVVLASAEKVRLGNKKHTSHNSTTQQLMHNVQQLLIKYSDAIQTHSPKTWRNSAGYGLYRMNADNVDLAQLIVGAEGTLATVVSAELNLVQCPLMTCLAIVHFQDLITSLEAVPVILETEPSAVELLDQTILDRTRQHQEFSKLLTFVEGNPEALLVVEYYGESEAELSAKIQRLKIRLSQWGHNEPIVVATTLSQQANVWRVRKAGLGLLASNRSDWKTVPCIEDAAVPVEHLAEYIRRIINIVHAQGATMAVYAHASAGCLHVRPLLNLKTAEGIRQYRAIAEAAVDVVLEFGGTTSGEHSEGIVRGEFNERLFGHEMMQAFREIKQMFDPHKILNPNRIIDVPRMDDQSLMRYGENYSTPLKLVNTRFDWQDDNGFDGAVEMCNGAGVCRKEDIGTMCPSFMATREEIDSTRGRANILRLAMTGKFGLSGMQDERVKAVLDLCLSCKACKAECPSAVDMARIKSEFMANYQDHHGIPLRSRIFSTVHLWGRLGGRFPMITNILMNFPILESLMKRVLKIAPERKLPHFAKQTFSRWWHRQPSWAQQHTSAPPTPILLIDTFTEYYHPQLGEAVAYVAQQLGLPLRAMRFPQNGCCGRPSISKGLLDIAKDLATRNVQYFAHMLSIDSEARFMVLEPSCLSAFKDDYIHLVEPEWRKWAQKIAERMMSVEDWLAELQSTELYHKLNWDQRKRHLILHGHCHQKALWGTIAAHKALSNIPNTTIQELDAGCCGMAGSFGYETEHFNVSITIAEKRLYPAIRSHPDAIFVASGTSCREQIAHIQGKAYHPIEVVATACGWQST
ncbi:MAG: FAD-binding oxidoreductase [Phototrophicales bacterium]|nr:MAG: FAD-binding oxidoreductase [Phototrophicales bacterium]